MSPTTRIEALELLVLGNSGSGLKSNGSLPSGVSVNVTISGDYPNALALLRKPGRHAARRPALILLDLDGHCEQGWTLLREIKGDPQLRRIPVVVLGAANSSEEWAHAYDLRANCYLPRPADEERLGRLLERIEEFWLTRVRLPVG